VGFQHICAENSLGRLEVRRITDGDRRGKKLRELKQQIRRRMHDPVAQVGAWLESVLHGYYQYHAVPGNPTVLKRFRRQVRPIPVPCAGIAQPKAAHLGKVGEIIRSMYWIDGYPRHTLFMIIQMRVSTPAAFGRHIRSNNRVR
jgi:hypothetical protein